MKNLFLMSLFGLCMTVAFGAQTVSGVSLVAAAYADDEATTTPSSDDVAFSCPEGVTTCYRADGSEYTDVNNFSATAAGIESDDEYESDDDDEHESDDESSPTTTTTKYANPRHYRSF